MKQTIKVKDTKPGEKYTWAGREYFALHNKWPSGDVYIYGVPAGYMGFASYIPDGCLVEVDRLVTFADVKIGEIYVNSFGTPCLKISKTHFVYSAEHLAAMRPGNPGEIVDGITELSEDSD